MEISRLFLLFGIAYLMALVSSAVGSQCDQTQNRLLCQMVSRVINCSANGGGDGRNVAYFVQPQPEDNPALIRLSLATDSDANFSVASLSGLLACFMLQGGLRLELTPGSGECSLLPGSLDSLSDIRRRLTLQLRFASSRIPTGVFSSRLSTLRNLQLETLRVSEIQAGAFNELHSLERLSLARLQMDRLDRSLLRGLSNMRILELTDNWLTILDADSFAASPLLEQINLRTNKISDQLTVANDTFCDLKRLRELTITAEARLTCEHFASRRLHLRLTSRSETRVLSCVRLLGQSTVCTGTAGIRRTSTISTTSTTTRVPMTTSNTPTTNLATSLLVSTTYKSVSTRQRKPEAKTTLRAISTVTTTKPVRTTSVVSSSSSFLEPGGRTDNQAKSSVSGSTAAGPIIAGVLIAAVGLLAIVSVGIFLATRRGRLRRSRSQQPIMYSSGGAGEIDMQDAVWNPNFQDRGFSEAVSSDVTAERED